MNKKICVCEEFTIYNGNSLAILPFLSSCSVDGIITDPPYCSGGVTLANKQSEPAKKYQSSGTKRTYPAMLGDGKDQRSFTTWATIWLAECWRIAKDGAPLLVFTDWRQLPSITDAIQAAGWFWLGIIPWDKRSSRPQKGKFRQQCEYVIFASKGRFIPKTTICLPGVYSYPVIAQHKVHLTSKPLELLKDLFKITEPSGIILDPFIGGGTTAVAAYETGRKCIGIELSSEYVELTIKRIEAAMITAKKV